MESHMIRLQETAHVRNLYLASTIAMLPGFTFGALLAYSAMAVPQMMETNPTGIVIDIYQASWLVSVMQPTRVLGSMSTAVLQDRVGRRACLLLCSVTQLLACSLLYFSNSFPFLFAAFCCAGATTGMALLPSYSLLSEFSLIRLRGALGSLNTLNVNGGYLYGMLVSLALPVSLLPLTTLLPSLLFLALYWKLPESPLWLVREGRCGEAREVVQWLRGEHYCVEPEVKELEAIASEEKVKVESIQGGAGGGGGGGAGGGGWAGCGALKDRTFLLPLFIICSLFTIQGLSGADTMSYYAITMFAQWGFPSTSVAILFQAMITLGYIISPLVMSRINTRPQFILALVTSALAQLGMAASLLLPSLSPLSLPSLIAAGLVYGLGVGPVPFVTMSAIFPQKYKTIGMCAAQITRAMVVMAQLKAFPYLTSLLGTGGLFLCHAATLILGAIFTFIMVPETRNKSLTELEQIFSKTGAKEGVSGEKAVP